MRCLVAGGAGFIGSNLCRFLLNHGHSVVCVDNLATSSENNFIDLLKNPDFKFIQHDIINPINLEVDCIYNLACPASPPEYQKDPIKTIKTSTIGMINLLELAKTLKIPILQASTSEVYGDPLIHPQSESYWGNVNPVGVRSCYDEGKRIAETLCFDYNRIHAVDVKIVRIFNTYGPFMNVNDGRVVSNFIVQALLNKDITIYGDGSQTRSFQYVDDLIIGMYMMMNSKNFLGPVNLGNPEEYTIVELAKKIIFLTNSNSRIIHCPLPSDDPKKRKPDISLAIKKLDWYPKVNVDDGLNKTMNLSGLKAGVSC